VTALHGAHSSTIASIDEGPCARPGMATLTVLSSLTYGSRLTRPGMAMLTVLPSLTYGSRLTMVATLSFKPTRNPQRICTSTYRRVWCIQKKCSEASFFSVCDSIGSIILTRVTNMAGILARRLMPPQHGYSFPTLKPLFQESSIRSQKPN
jgi:hypothetical protein